MYPRTNYEMTQEDLDSILDACKSTVCIQIGDYQGSSPQENANRAWASLGDKMGFNSLTVEPRAGMGNRFFTAVPNETLEAKAERESREKEEALRSKITTLEAEIKERQAHLTELLNP